MEVGCCCNMIATGTDGIGLEWAETLKNAGCDYLELPLAQIMALDEGKFQRLLAGLEKAGIPCRACNNFFPASVRLTGPNVDPIAVTEYIVEAIKRASKLGAETIVFGSSGAKNVPQGFSHEEAARQLVGLLRTVGFLVHSAGIRIAVEPLNRNESNIINTLSEGLSLVKAVGMPEIMLLIDYYHFAVEGDRLETVRKDADKIIHVHFANPCGRTFPCTDDTGDYESFFTFLRLIRYNRRFSIEAYSKNIKRDVIPALTCIRSLAGQTGI